jgi:hypothetical protein
VLKSLWVLVKSPCPRMKVAQKSITLFPMPYS